MVFQNLHWDCNENDCKRLTSYVRIDGKWQKIGYFGTVCKKFELLDVEKERQERASKENVLKINAELKKIKQEGKERLKIIENELNMNKSFFN